MNVSVWGGGIYMVDTLLVTISFTLTFMLGWRRTQWGEKIYQKKLFHKRTVKPDPDDGREGCSKPAGWIFRVESSGKSDD